MNLSMDFFKFGPVVQMLFKSFIFSSGGHFVQLRRTIYMQLPLAFVCFCFVALRPKSTAMVMAGR